MRTLPRVVGIAAVLIALSVAAGWWARSDLHDRVQLTTRASHSAGGASGVATGLATQPAPPCAQADLDVWQMPAPPDAGSRHATLYSDRFGTKRASQGQTLVPGVMVDSVTPTQVTLVCAGGHSTSAIDHSDANLAQFIANSIACAFGQLIRLDPSHAGRHPRARIGLL